MKKGMIVAALAVVCGAGSLLAGEGLPSQSKLNKLGLSSMRVASDHAGQQVRGQGFVKIVFNWHTAAGEKAVLVNGPQGSFITISPFSFRANAQDNGSGITSDGAPLSYKVAEAQIVNIASESYHQQDVLDSSGNFAFSEISASQTFSTVVAGNAWQLGYAQ